MDTEIGALIILWTEEYYWITVWLMFLIHVGFCTYEVGASRRKNLQHTLMKNTLLIPLVTITFFFVGWWIYFAFTNGPWIMGGIVDAPWATPWSELMGPHMGGPPVSESLTADDTAFWARINGVFWAAFLLFSWTAASIVSGAVIERVRTLAFVMVAILVGSITWMIDAAWGWSPAGWMVQLMGYHDAYASGVIHGIAGGTALAFIAVLGPRLGKFGANGEVRDIPQHNPWMACLGLFLIFVGFWGFYAACNVPMIDIDPSEEGVFFSATNIYLMPTTLSAITVNFIMSLSGGLLVGYMVSKADPFWTYSGGLGGIIAASAGNDLYHPIQALIIAGVGVWIMYKLHYWVERRFRIDDAVGAVAVHGYAGTFGVIIAGFVLWGYPAVDPAVIGGDLNAAWFGSTAEGFPAINPLGQIIGAFIMMFVLGFAPAWVLAKILDAFGVLRIPREVELVGLDAATYGDNYAYFGAKESAFEPLERGAPGD